MQYVVRKQAPTLKDLTTTRGWSLDSLVNSGERFQEVPRVSASTPDLLTVIESYERRGVPLIIEGWHKEPTWPHDIFTLDWFEQHGPQRT